MLNNSRRLLTAFPKYLLRQRKTISVAAFETRRNAQFFLPEELGLWVARWCEQQLDYAVLFWWEERLDT